MSAVTDISECVHLAEIEREMSAEISRLVQRDPMRFSKWLFFFLECWT